MLLVRHADLHDPSPVGVVDVLVVAGRVAAIGRDLDVGTLPVEVVELDGAPVVPGLVDGHVHVTGGGGEGGPATSAPPLGAVDLLTAGVTSVVGLLGTDDVSRRPGDVLRRVRALQAHGMGAWMLTGGYHLPVRTMTGEVGRDFLLVPEVVGAGEVAISDHRSSEPTTDELRRLGAEVHVGGMLAGRRGTVHLHVGDGGAGLDRVFELADGDLPPRLWHPTHCNRLPGLLDAAWELQSRGVTIDVTAFPVDDADPAVASVDAVDRWLSDGAPGRLTVSSDSGGSLPVFDEDGVLVRHDVAAPTTLWPLVRDLVRRGHDLANILPVLTTHPADQFGLDRGRLHVGRPADLLVLNDDLGIHRVLAGGRWHDLPRTTSTS